jgi:endonuclease G, mitochondrial
MTDHDRAGYDENFLGEVVVPLPGGAAVAGYHVTVLKHVHFTTFYDTGKRITIVGAANVDASSFALSTPRVNRVDSRVPEEKQYTNAWYRHDPYDKGHMVRRKTVRWGPAVEAYQAERESDMWTNQAPHHVNFHRDEWKAVEHVVLSLIKHNAKDKKGCVFTGSHFSTDIDHRITDERDDGSGSRVIPNAYWKAVVYRNRLAEGHPLITDIFWVDHNEAIEWDRNLALDGVAVRRFIISAEELNARAHVQL